MHSSAFNVETVSSIHDYRWVSKITLQKLHIGTFTHVDRLFRNNTLNSSRCMSAELVKENANINLQLCTFQLLFYRAQLIRKF